MQTVFVVVIVALAVFYLVRRFYKSVQQRDTEGCGGDCACCGQARKTSCPEPDHRKDPT